MVLELTSTNMSLSCVRKVKLPPKVPAWLPLTGRYQDWVPWRPLHATMSGKVGSGGSWLVYMNQHSFPRTGHIFTPIKIKVLLARRRQRQLTMCVPWLICPIIAPPSGATWNRMWGATYDDHCFLPYSSRDLERSPSKWGDVLML